MKGYQFQWPKHQDQHAISTGQARRAVSFPVQLLVGMFPLFLNAVHLDHQLFRWGAFSSHHHESHLTFSTDIKGSSNLHFWVCNIMPYPPYLHTLNPSELYSNIEQEFNASLHAPTCRHLTAVCGTTLKMEGKTKIICSWWVFCATILQEQEALHPWQWTSGTQVLHIGRNSQFLVKGILLKGIKVFCY